MPSAKENKVLVQSKAFAVRIIRLYQYLTSTKQKFIIAKQILRSGASIGANISEAQGAQTKADFIYKVQISLKEANETEYWLDALCQTGYITQPQYDSMKADLDSLIFMMIRILKTAKSNSQNPKT